MKYLLAIALLCTAGCASLNGTTSTTQPINLINTALYGLSVFNSNGCVPPSMAVDPAMACAPTAAPTTDNLNACFAATLIQQLTARVPKCSTVPMLTAPAAKS